MTAAVSVHAGLLAAAVVLLWPGLRTDVSALGSRLASLQERGGRSPRGTKEMSTPPTRGLARRVLPSEVADGAELVALSLRSGAPVVDAVERVAVLWQGPVGRDLRQVVAALRWGLDGPGAWRLCSPEWEPVARALTLAMSAGVPAAGLLEESARDLRRAESARTDQAIARLGVRLVLPLGLAFLPAFVLTTVLPLVLGLAGQLLDGV